MDLQKAGFHVIRLQKLQEISPTLPLPYETSIVNLVREITQGKLHKLTIVNGLDDFLRGFTDDAIIQVRQTLNKAIKDMLGMGASMIFVVLADIEDIPDNPKVCQKPLAMVFPRPHSIDFMEPGYLCYPIM